VKDQASHFDQRSVTQIMCQIEILPPDLEISSCEVNSLFYPKTLEGSRNSYGSQMERTSGASSGRSASISAIIQTIVIANLQTVSCSLPMDGHYATGEDIKGDYTTRVLIAWQ